MHRPEFASRRTFLLKPLTQKWPAETIKSLPYSRAGVPPSWEKMATSPFSRESVMFIEARRQGTKMTIYRLLQNVPIGSEEISRLTTAYERTLRTIGIVDRGDALAELVARKILEVAQTGIRQPADISAQAIKEIADAI